MNKPQCKRSSFKFAMSSFTIKLTIARTDWGSDVTKDFDVKAKARTNDCYHVLKESLRPGPRLRTNITGVGGGGRPPRRHPGFFLVNFDSFKFRQISLLCIPLPAVWCLAHGGKGANVIS
jgi:hypothetical protein